MKTVRRILPIALILLVPMVMLYPIWRNPVSAGEDDVIYYYPLRKIVGESLGGGRLPLYNDREATGTPIMADPQSAVIYPPTWMFAGTDTRLAYSLSVFLAFSIAGGGAYAYLRRLGLIGPAATFGAVAFMFCGFFVGHRVHLGIIHTACYFPWGLWSIEGLRRDRPPAGVSLPARLRPSPAALWIVPITYLAITAGHWPTLVQMTVAWAGYLFLRARPLLRSIVTATLGIALAAALAAPQVLMTAELLAHTTRHRIGYAMAGENSFFPAAGVLAMFPMLMGSRTPNFFPQRWWGPWHLCEMLGYVGLITLVLAGATVRRMYRKTPAESPEGIRRIPQDIRELQELVRKWTWMAIGAFIWMLGYYLPTYRLVHWLPVLGVMRCPGRLVLIVDMALAVLGGISIHVLVSRADAEDRMELSTNSLSRTIGRAASVVLPVTMLTVLVMMGVGGLLLRKVFPGVVPFFNGGARDVLAAIRPANPAVWVPLGLMIATGLAVRYWLVRPQRRVVVLVGLLLADLFFITRFVDVPPPGMIAPDPERSPAAVWLRENAPTDRPYRVWGLSEAYHHRPAELLLPKTSSSLGFSTIAGYGPFQSPVHAHLLGFRIFGTNRDWERLIRQNHLLSLYNVRYILAAAPRFRRVVESVRVPAGPPPPEGPNLLTGDWSLTRAQSEDGHLRLETPFLWSWSGATHPVTLKPGAVCRIALDARGERSGAGNFLRAEISQKFSDGSYLQDDSLGATVYSEQIGRGWRSFEWTFRVPRTPAVETTFRVFTMSERAILVRNISLRQSAWDPPIGVNGRLVPGERIYRKLVELPARCKSDPPVAIYENLLCRAVPVASTQDAWSNESIERLKWGAIGRFDDPGEVPDLGIPPIRFPGRKGWALIAVGVVGYLFMGIAARRCGRRGKKFT